MINPALLNDTADHYPYEGLGEDLTESFGTKQTLEKIRVRVSEEIQQTGQGERKRAVYTFWFDLTESNPTTYTHTSFNENDKIVYGGKELRIRTIMPSQSTVQEFVKFTAVTSE